MTDSYSVKDNFITKYKTFVKNTEAPRNFPAWVAISTIAAALQRKVWMRFGGGIVYPNEYIVLVAPTGVGKGISMRPAEEIIQKADLDINIIPKATTKERIIEIMMAGTRTFRVGAQEFEHSSTHTFSEELSVFLGMNDAGMLSHVTDWFDCHNIWNYETKNQGCYTIPGVCFNMIGGTARDWLPQVLPKEAIGGGFTSRVIFVAALSGTIKDPFDNRPLAQKDEEEYKLIKHLQKIHKMTGEFIVTPALKERWRSDYMSYRQDLQNEIYPIKDSNFEGYARRRHLHIAKIAMCIAAGRLSNVIDLGDYEMALATLIPAEQMMPMVFSGMTDSTISKGTIYLHEYMTLGIRKGVSKLCQSEFLRLYMAKGIDFRAAQAAEETLTRSGYMTAKPMTRDNDTLYIPTASYLAQIQPESSSQKSDKFSPEEEKPDAPAESQEDSTETTEPGG